MLSPPCWVYYGRWMIDYTPYSILLSRVQCLWGILFNTMRFTTTAREKILEMLHQKPPDLKGQPGDILDERRSKRDWIIFELAQGMPLKVIARQYQVTEAYVAKIRQEYAQQIQDYRDAMFREGHEILRSAHLTAVQTLQQAASGWMHYLNPETGESCWKEVEPKVRIQAANAIEAKVPAEKVLTAQDAIEKLRQELEKIDLHSVWNAKSISIPVQEPELEGEDKDGNGT